MSGNIDKFTGFNWNSRLLRISRHAFLLIGAVAAMGVAATGAAAAQATIPDAQVEANVLKALAGAPELANESITTRTVYGTVTLSGVVTTEAARTRAENLAANANGVKKVVDELSLTSDSAQAVPIQQPAAQNPAQSTPDNAAPLLLQSDGTYAPAGAQDPAPGSAPAATAQRNNPDADQALDQQMAQQQGQQPAQPNQQPQQGQQPGQTASAQPYPAQPQPYSRRPMYPNYPGYTPYPNGNPQGQQPPAGYVQQPYPQQPGQPPMGGQVAGQPVTIPAGAMLRVRINHTLTSNHTQAGTPFDGTVVNDVVANGFVAIPRGATVQGQVVETKSSGALTGRGELSIQLTSVTLAGKTYPLATDIWARNGNDKTAETVGKTAGIGILGAIIGAAAGGGKGAAIGGGVGAAAGLGSSAASGNGQVFLPAEAIVAFRTTSDTPVATVSEQEMQRLAYGAGPGAEQPPARRVYRVYPGYPPGYYPAYPPPGYPPY